VGREQARAVAPVMAAAAPSLVVSSHLSRAYDTALAVAELTGLAPVVDPRLAEVHLGTWQGLTQSEAQERHPEEHAAWRQGADVRRGGGETYQEVGERAAACVLAHLAAVPDGGTLLAVTHGGTARAALGALLELPPQVWVRLVALGNCAWSVLVEGDVGWRLERHGASAEPSAGAVRTGPGDGYGQALAPAAPRPL
jgi:broad specificity phosphatase PhoE